MDRTVAALAAVWFAWTAHAQGTTHSHRPPPGEKQTPPVSAAKATDARDAYRSAFSDYHPFSQELAPKEWRRANDEVREAGGHAGLLKGEPAQLKGHGSHGAKQQTPPAAHHK